MNQSVGVFQLIYFDGHLKQYTVVFWNRDSFIFLGFQPVDYAHRNLFKRSCPHQFTFLGIKSEVELSDDMSSVTLC
jgi:hypothetical protein